MRTKLILAITLLAVAGTVYSQEDAAARLEAAEQALGDGDMEASFRAFHSLQTDHEAAWDEEVAQLAGEPLIRLYAGWARTNTWMLTEKKPPYGGLEPWTAGKVYFTLRRLQDDLLKGDEARLGKEEAKLLPLLTAAARGFIDAGKPAAFELHRKDPIEVARRHLPKKLWQVHSSFAAGYVKRKDWAGALDELTQAIAATGEFPVTVPNKDHPRLFRLAANLSLKLDDRERALGLYDQGLARLVEERERLLARERVSDAMREVMLKSLRKSEDELFIGRLQLLIGMPDRRPECLKSLLAAVERFPDRAPIHRVAAGRLAEKDPAGAVKLYERAAELDPESFDTWLGWGMLHVNQASELGGEPGEAQFAKALACLERAHELKPDHAEVLKQIISICGLLGADEKMATYRARLKKLQR